MQSLLASPQRTDLTATLVRVCRECGVAVENLRAEQLIRDARQAWPGEESERWRDWLREAGSSLALRSRVLRLTLDEALRVARDGALLVGAYRPGESLTVLVGGDGNSAQVAVGQIDERERLTSNELRSRLKEAGEEDDTHAWLVVEHPELADAEDARRLSGHPVRRLFGIIRPEWPDIWVILVFAFLVGLLNLSTPIAVEALVDTVAFGTLLQPVLVLATILFGFLAFAASIQGLQTYVAEIIQRRLFARVAADLAYRLPRVDLARMQGRYGPELVNRFLDVVTLQKVTAQLLLDGVNIVLATLVGMTVLAFYHPWLLGFDVLLLVLIIGGLMSLGRGGIASGIVESKMKYRLTAWFEDLMRCPAAFKADGGSEFAVDRANTLTAEYLTSRQRHFSILFRQIVFILGLQAIAGTVLLGGGGWLVIQGQLSLGQLVAAELIVTTILASMAKLGKHLEGFYDVVAAVDKLGVLFDLEVERHDGALALSDGKGVRIQLEGVRRNGAGPLLSRGLTATIEAGEHVAVYGGSGSGKSALMRVLYGALAPDGGHVDLQDADPRDLRPDVLRSRVTLVGEPEFFAGTIAENVHLSRPGVTSTDVRAALESVGVLDDLMALREGLETKISPLGEPLSGNQQRLVMLARVLVDDPGLILIDGTLDSLADNVIEQVTNTLVTDERATTLLVATGRRDIADRFDRVIEASGATPPKGGSR